VIKLIHFTHWAVLAFVLTAWAWPFQLALWVHAAFVPLMVIHWRTNRNRCFLSQLEERYKAASVQPNMDLTLIDAEESQFIKMVFTKILGHAPAPELVEKITYGLVTIVWLLTVARLIRGA
jgi:hypothetical protein